MATIEAVCILYLLATTGVEYNHSIRKDSIRVEIKEKGGAQDNFEPFLSSLN